MGGDHCRSRSSRFRSFKFSEAPYLRGVHRVSANQPTPEHVALARWLLGHEAKQGGDATPAARVYDKLLTQVTPLLGAAGAEMLFVRSAKLTGDGFHVLASVPLLDGEPSLRATLHSADPAVATESATNLFPGLCVLPRAPSLWTGGRAPR